MAQVTGGMRAAINAGLGALVLACVLLGGALLVNGGYQRGHAAGYEAGYADAARVACTVPGEVSGLCWTLVPQLPGCAHEDGAPEGCLRKDSDGSTYWEVTK